MEAARAMTSSNHPVINLSSGQDLHRAFERGVDALFAAGTSDITIQSDDYIWAYINRQHVQASNRRLEDGEVSALLRRLYGSEGGFGILGSGSALDFEATIRPRMDESEPDYDADYAVRCRANATRVRVAGVANGTSITLRTIPGFPPKIEDLALPQEIVETIFPTQGLVLVVGITGSGKSTLLAACNRARLERTDHPVKIMTVEDPIEFVFGRLPSMSANGQANAPGQAKARMPEVSQIQIGAHLREFAMVAPNILRRKGDVIVMGEMRDAESVSTGLLLAQTGHATYATLHCETPAEAIGRIVTEFPMDAQPGVANKLLGDLRLIVAQKIVRDIAGKGRAFRSWCVFDQELKAHLAEHPYPQWARLITRVMQEKGQTFADQARQALIDGALNEQAFADVAGFNPVEARQYMKRHGIAFESREKEGTHVC